MTFTWVEIAPWRWAYVESETDTSVSTVFNGTQWERHGHLFDAIADAKADTETWAADCMPRHGKLPDISHR